MVQDPALAAPATGAGGGAAAAPKERPAAAAAGAAPAEASAPTLGEVEALPSIPGATASEPVSAESTEDLRESGGGGGSGIMQAARHAVVDAAEGAMEAVEPGREQVGEVIQETESGGEEAQEGDVLGSAVRAVTGAAAAAAHKLGALTDRAYQALRKEAPGADVSGEGAPIKSLATAPVVGEEEQRARLEPASFEPAPRPSPLPATSGGGEEPQSGYESDTEEPGPVLEGVHPAHYQPTGGQPGAEPYPPHHHHRHHHHHAGGQVQGTIVAAAEQAGTPHSHITEGTPAEEEPQGASEGPAPAAEAPAGRLGRAAEAASELAATAAGKVKHAAAVATGTAEEQRQPGQQLADLQRSIAAMEEERAGDVRFQQAGKQLGL